MNYGKQLLSFLCIYLLNSVINHRTLLTDCNCLKIILLSAPQDTICIWFNWLKNLTAVMEELWSSSVWRKLYSWSTLKTWINLSRDALANNLGVSSEFRENLEYSRHSTSASCASIKHNSSNEETSWILILPDLEIICKYSFFIFLFFFNQFFFSHLSPEARCLPSGATLIDLTPLRPS